MNFEFKSLKRTPPIPNGWIQWKGTNVCIDIHCICGESSHYDGDFMYFIECGYCGRVYECGGYIKLYERDKLELISESIEFNKTDI